MCQMVKEYIFFSLASLGIYISVTTFRIFKKREEEYYVLKTLLFHY